MIIYVLVVWSKLQGVDIVVDVIISKAEIYCCIDKPICDNVAISLHLANSNLVTELISGYRYIIHKDVDLSALSSFLSLDLVLSLPLATYPQHESSIRIFLRRTMLHEKYMSESAGRYIEGTIPDWLIRGLDGLGGWSIAKLIRE